MTRRSVRTWAGVGWGGPLVVLALVALARCARGPSMEAPRAPQRAPIEVPSPPPPSPALTGIAASPHVALGIPVDADPSDDVLVDERVYVASFNPIKAVANWVSWNLSRSDLGHVHRRDDFRADPALPAGVYHPTPHDFTRSGYDRGHLCPSADRTASPEDNSLTFLMTNMHPQLHELNAGPWEQLEQHERELASRPGVELHIVAGGIFDRPWPTIGHGIAVPRASFKILAVLRTGQRAADVDASTQVIAVVMPNRPGVGARGWADYVATVDAIEAATGYDFLPSVPAEVQAVIEARAQPYSNSSR